MKLGLWLWRILKKWILIVDQSSGQMFIHPPPSLGKGEEKCQCGPHLLSEILIGLSRWERRQGHPLHCCYRGFTSFTAVPWGADLWQISNQRRNETLSNGVTTEGEGEIKWEKLWKGGQQQNGRLSIKALHFEVSGAILLTGWCFECELVECERFVPRTL